MEVFKDIKDFEGLYQISNLGNVKSLQRKFVGKDKILRPKTSRDGYLSVCLSKNAVHYHLRINRLVAQAFIPNPENKEQTNHKNFIRTDNRVENLEWCTPKENIAHTIKINGWGNSKGSKNGTSKLNENKIVRIRKILSKNKFTRKQVALKFGVCRQAIDSIANNLTWRHVL